VKILSYFGLDDNASAEAIDGVYNDRHTRLYEAVFLKGIEGERAACELNALEEAYKEAKNYINNRDFGENNPEIAKLVNEAAASGNPEKVQAYLDVILDKTAYWHYVQSVVYYIKHLYFDSIKHLKTALTLDKLNEKYSKALYRLEEKILLQSGFVDDDK
jgi:hypothetical protein